MQAIEKQLIVGLDLSLRSTGITFSYLENFEGKKIEFYRLVYETKPRPIQNINQETYTKPTNISIDDLLVFVDDTTDMALDDITNQEQADITLRTMICAKRIHMIIERAIQKYNPDTVYFCIENFIMPSFAGKRQLAKTVSLIMLQGYVRSNIIRMKIDPRRSFKNVLLMLVTPTALKKFFTNNGRAEKPEMLKSFIENYGGGKLLPDNDHGKIDDVIDSFALMCCCYSKIAKSIKQ